MLHITNPHSFPSRALVSIRVAMKFFWKGNYWENNFTTIYQYIHIQEGKRGGQKASHFILLAEEHHVQCIIEFTTTDTQQVPAFSTEMTSLSPHTNKHTLINTLTINNWLQFKIFIFLLNDHRSISTFHVRNGWSYLQPHVSYLQPPHPHPCFFFLNLCTFTNSICPLISLWLQGVESNDLYQKLKKESMRCSTSI